MYEVVTMTGTHYFDTQDEAKEFMKENLKQNPVLRKVESHV